MEPGSSHAWLLLKHPETQAVSAWRVTVPSDPAVNHGNPGTGYYGVTTATGGDMIIHQWLNKYDTNEIISIDIDIYSLWHCLDFDTKMSLKRRRNLRSAGKLKAEEREITLKSEEFCLFLLDALNHDDIQQKFKGVIGYDEDKLSQKNIQSLSSQIIDMKKKLVKKDQEIAELQSRVITLEEKQDDYEQYSRRNILRISGIPEKLSSDHAVRRLCHDILDVPISETNIDRSHRIGHKPEKPATNVTGQAGTTQASSSENDTRSATSSDIVDAASPDSNSTVTARGSVTDHQGGTAEPKDGGTAVSSSLTMPGSAEGDRDDCVALPNLDIWTTNPPGRVVMVKFANYRAQELVYKAQTNLKSYNSDNPGHKIFTNEDLTKFRANLCYEARKLRNQGLCEVWPHDDRVLIKEVYNKIHLIKNMSDLNQFKANKKNAKYYEFC